MVCTHTLSIHCHLITLYRSIGTTPSKSGDLVAARRINVDYTKAAAETFANKLAPQLGEKTTFRFIYVSGAGTERNQDQKLWFAQDFRRMRVCLPSSLCLEMCFDDDDVFREMPKTK